MQVFLFLKCWLNWSLLILLMEEIRQTHQLRLVVYSTTYRVLYIPGGCLGFLSSAVLMLYYIWKTKLSPSIMQVFFLLKCWPNWDLFNRWRYYQLQLVEQNGVLPSCQWTFFLNVDLHGMRFSFSWNDHPKYTKISQPDKNIYILAVTKDMKATCCPSELDETWNHVKTSKCQMCFS